MKIDDVRRAFDKVPEKGEKLTFSRGPIPSGGHFQGIQYFDSPHNCLVITSSSSTDAYVVVCDLSTSNSEEYTIIGASVKPPLNHAGGFQSFDSNFAIGLEDHSDLKKSARVHFFTLSGKQLETSTYYIERGTGKANSAGAVGITTMGEGKLLAVGSNNCDTITFYVQCSGRDDFWEVGRWEKSKADKTGWSNESFGGYQSINLIEQSDGQLFMLGFHRSKGRDFMDLYEVRPTFAKPSGILKKINGRHMISDGGNFLGGSGIHVSSKTTFDVWAVSQFSGNAKKEGIIETCRFITPTK